LFLSAKQAGFSILYRFGPWERIFNFIHSERQKDIFFILYGFGPSGTFLKLIPRGRSGLKYKIPLLWRSEIIFYSFRGAETEHD
jgi:hypothetical protein